MEERYRTIPRAVLDGTFVTQTVTARDRYKLRESLVEYRHILLEKQVRVMAVCVCSPPFQP